MSKEKQLITHEERRMLTSPDYHRGYQDGLADGAEHAKKFLETQVRPVVVQGDLAQPSARKYHCSCGAACTAEEYIHHYFELKHDRGLAQPDPARLNEIRGRAKSNTGPTFGYTHQLTQDIDYLLSCFSGSGGQPLCPVHQRLEDADKLELEIGNDCVACSLNERAELLTMLEPFAPTDRTLDSVTVLRNLIGRATGLDSGGEREWLPYVHETCPRETWIWLAFENGNVGLHWLKTEPFFWFENSPTHYMIAMIPAPPAATSSAPITEQFCDCLMPLGSKTCHHCKKKVRTKPDTPPVPEDTGGEDEQLHDEMERDAMIDTINLLHSERDQALLILKEALDQTGCDGDLCNYRWHERARSLIADAHDTNEVSAALRSRGDSVPVEQDVEAQAGHFDALVGLFTAEANRLHKIPGAFTNRLALVAAQYITTAFQQARSGDSFAREQEILRVNAELIQGNSAAHNVLDEFGVKREDVVWEGPIQHVTEYSVCDRIRFLGERNDSFASGAIQKVTELRDGWLPAASSNDNEDLAHARGLVDASEEIITALRALVSPSESSGPSGGNQ